MTVEILHNQSLLRGQLRTSLYLNWNQKVSDAWLGNQDLPPSLSLRPLKVFEGQNLVFKLVQLSEQVTGCPPLGWVLLEHAAQHAREVFAVILEDIFHQVVLLTATELQRVPVVEIVTVAESSSHENGDPNAEDFSSGGTYFRIGSLLNQLLIDLLRSYVPTQVPRKESAIDDSITFSQLLRIWGKKHVGTIFDLPFSLMTMFDGWTSPIFLLAGSRQKAASSKLQSRYQSSASENRTLSWWRVTIYVLRTCLQNQHSISRVPADPQRDSEVYLQFVGTRKISFASSLRKCLILVSQSEKTFWLLSLLCIFILS